MRRGKNHCRGRAAPLESGSVGPTAKDTGPGTIHRPVLLEEVIEALAMQPGGRYIDCTLGGAGHAAEILERSSPNGHLLGLDADPGAVERGQYRLAPFVGRYRLVQSNFRELARVARTAGFDPVDGILFDFGLSSDQLSQAGRGFSFQGDAPLDMRFDPAGPRTAATLVNSLSEEELANVIYEFGEETRSRRIARSIVAARPIETTRELVEAVERAVGPGGRRHSATKVFQALRIAVNEEIETIRFVLPQAVDLLAQGGRLVTISFHSLEDRVVKEFLRREAIGWHRSDLIDRGRTFRRTDRSERADRPGPDLPAARAPAEPPAPRLKLVTRKVIMASAAERRENPRSRSAKMRVAERR